MNVFDLDAPAPTTEEDVQGDVCIIGAGAAGIYLAVRLATLGSRVVVVEAGGRTCESPVAAGFEPAFTQDPYPAATQGRSFGVGGSTSRWGGLLVPHTRRDLRPSGHRDEKAWGHIVEQVERNADTVLRTLGYPGGADFETFPRRMLGGTYAQLEEAGIKMAAGLFLPVRRKNFASLLEDGSVRSALIQLAVHAVAKSWEVASSGEGGPSVKRLVAVSRQGRRLRVSARHFVVAAGAIESARILLELRAETGGAGIRPSAAIGRYLADHLSVSIADVAVPAPGRMLHQFVPHFSGAWMRNFRFSESAAPPEAPKAFTHFIFENDHAGFRLAKEVLSALQARRWPKVGPELWIRGTQGVLALAYARFVQSMLYVPDETPAHLQLDVEQIPSADNWVTLGAASDAYGRRTAGIEWRITDQDTDAVQQAAVRFLAKWPGQRAGVPDLQPRRIDFTVSKPHDAYHPVGTCRMGRDAEAVVDHDLSVWGLNNLWVASTAVLPGAGTANPTFTLLCLAERLVDTIHKSHVGRDLEDQETGI